MLGFAARLIGGVVTPLIDQASSASARLLRKLALFLVAGLCLLVVVGALTVAFDLWVASMKGPIIGALAVAGLYFVIALVAVLLAVRKVRPTAAVEGTKTEASAAKEERDSDIDAFTAPLMQMLSRFGLRREQMAVLAGMSVAKQIGPLPLVGLAIVAGFLIGRLGRGILPSDLIDTILASDLVAALLGRKERTDDPDVQDDARAA